MKIRPERRVPPGTDWRRELKWIALGLGAAFLYSLTFFLRFIEERNSLYLWAGTVKVLFPVAVMQDFAYILSSALVGFPVVALAMVALAAWHYAGHYIGSKSIYLMRRLPDRLELHRRCLTLPVAAAAVALLLGFILLLLYYWVYMAATPEGCLKPDQWQKLWIWNGVSP